MTFSWNFKKSNRTCTATQVAITSISDELFHITDSVFNLLVKVPFRSHYNPAMANLTKFTHLITIVFLFLITSKFAHSLDTISPKDIRPGMKGYGLTVFQGTTPEKFNVEVVSVVPNFLLRQDIILIRVDHPVTDNAGIIGGMSGSPIYINGKLAGALAYGWRFNKEPLAGVTPIDNMLDVLKRKSRHPSSPPSMLRKGAKVMGLNFDKLKRGPAPASGFFKFFKNRNDTDILPAKTPLTLGGFSPSASKILDETLSPFGIDPLIGGGSSGKIEGPTKFENGGSIGVQLIRGDMNATGIGTVTLVKGSDVLAFGHPMFNMGEGYFPVTTAHIHTVIASLARSNKLGSPLNVAGTLVQDRNACIAARTDWTSEMIPMTVNITDSRTKRKETYNVEIVSHPLLTPKFVDAALSNIITYAASDTEDVTAEIKGTMSISGRKDPLTLYDSGASRSGLGSMTRFLRPVAVIAAVMDNPFESVQVKKLSFDITLHFGLQYATVIGAYVTSENPTPGEIINVHVRLLKYDDEEKTLTVPIEIPLSAAEKTITIEAAGGDRVAPVMAVPRNLNDALDNVTRFYPSKSLVISVGVPGQGISMQGRILERLPASAVNTLKPSSGVDLSQPLKTELRKVTRTAYLVDGKESFKITVGPRRSK